MPPNIRDAQLAYEALNGIITVYKPSCMSIKLLQHNIVSSLCRDLNKLEVRPPSRIIRIEGETNKELSVKVVPNYADDTLVVGPRYQMQDIKAKYASNLGLFSSGVMIWGINSGTKTTFHLHQSRLTRAFKVQGRLGKATDTGFSNGKVVELASYGHVNRGQIDRVLSHMQTAHQRKMFELSGVHMESQAAYEMAAQGTIRPVNANLPVLYGIKCVDLRPPYFTIEVQSINENEKYLWTLIHDIGMQLKTVAHCTALQCIREGLFDLDVALLRKHWQLQHFLDNMETCQRILKENQRLLRPKSAALS